MKPRGPTVWERFNNWLDDMDGMISSKFFIPKYGYIIAFACVVKIIYNAVSIGLLSYQKQNNTLLTDQGHLLVRWAIIQSAVLMAWLFYMFFFTTCWRHLEDILQDMGPFSWKQRKGPGRNSYNHTNGRWKGPRSLNSRYVKEKEFMSNWTDTAPEQRAWVVYTFEVLSPDPQRAAHQIAWFRKEALVVMREHSFMRNTLLDNQDGTVWDRGVGKVVDNVVELHQIPNINDCGSEQEEEQQDHGEDHEEEQGEHAVVEVSATITTATDDLHPNPPAVETKQDKTKKKNVLPPTTKSTKSQPIIPIPDSDSINYGLLWSAQLAELSAGRKLCENFWVYSLYSQIPSYYWSVASRKKDIVLCGSSIYAICSILFHYAWLMYGTNEIVTLSKAGSAGGMLIKNLTPFVWKYSLAVLVIEWTYSTALIVTIICSLFDV